MRISDWSSDVCSSDRNEGSKIMQKKGGRTQDHAADMAAGWRIRPAPPEQRDRRCSGAKPMERSPPMLYLRICFDKPDMLARRDEYRQAHRAYLASGVVMLVQAGPMMADDDSHNIGSFMVVAAEDLERDRKRVG